MRSYLALSVAAFAGMAVAQDPYNIDPNSVPQSERAQWCLQQTSSCPLICTQQPGVDSMTTQSNECDTDDLSYSCVCENGIAPNLTMYSLTIPYFKCQVQGNQCVANCGQGSNTCQDECRSKNLCGAQQPYLGNATLSSLASVSATASKTGAAASNSNIPVTGFGGAAATSGSANSPTGAASAVIIPGATLGMAAVFGSVFLGFAILL